MIPRGRVRPVVNLVLAVGVLVVTINLWAPLLGFGAGGAWRVIPVPGDGEALVNVSCYSVSRCVGASIGSRQISRSMDGGTTWSSILGPRSAALGFTSLDCVKPATCFATSILGSLAPSGGSVLKSVDGGAHWRPVLERPAPGNPAYRFNDVSCRDAVSCLVTGTTGREGFVFVSSDGGIRWHIADLPFQPPHGTIEGADCALVNFCLATQGARALIYRSRDGGSHWSAEAVPLAFRRYEQEKGVSTGLTAVACGSPTFCVVGGFIAQSQLQGTTEPFKWVTRDGGTTWNVSQPFSATGAKSPAAVSVGAISCATSRDCLLGLAYGYVYVTHDRGVTWRRDGLSPRVDSDILGLSCVSANRCVASVISNFPSKKLFQGSIWLHTVR